MIDRTHFSVELTAAEVAYRHRRPQAPACRPVVRARPWAWLRRGNIPSA